MRRVIALESFGRQRELWWTYRNLEWSEVVSKSEVNIKQSTLDFHSVRSTWPTRTTDYHSARSSVYHHRLY